MTHSIFLRARPILWLLGCALLVTGGAQAARRSHVHALTHATVIVRPGHSIENATVVMRDGLIESVGRDGAVPGDAVEIDLTGHWVHAALIDADSSLEPDQPAADESAGGRVSSRDTPAISGAVHPLPSVRPETRASDRLQTIDIDDRQAERMRGLGFATVLVAPSRGLFQGRSSLISIAAGRPVAEMIVKDDLAQHVGLQRGGFGGGYPTSLMGAIAAIRQTLHDSRRHMLWSERYRSEPRGMQRPPRNNAFEALAPLLRGEQPLVVRASSPQDAMLAHRTAEEFDLPLLIAASGHEWELAAQLAETGRPLLYPIAFPDKPSIKNEHEALDISRRELRRYLDAAGGPSLLRDAGVPFALTTSGLKKLTDFGKNLREIAEAGMSEDQLLAALTTTPARLLGVDGVLGTVEAGKIGNLAVTDGPPFAEGTHVRRLFIDGIAHEFEVKEKPQGDPDAVVDPRGEWSVSYDMGARSFERLWTIEGDRDDYRGSAETQRGTVEFESVTLEGNAMTLVFPDRGGRGTMEAVVIIEGDSFEGSMEMETRSAILIGSRSRVPENRR